MATKREIQQQRAFRVQLYPVHKEFEIGLITREQYIVRWKEIYREVYGTKKEQQDEHQHNKPAGVGDHE